MLIDVIDVEAIAAELDAHRLVVQLRWMSGTCLDLFISAGQLCRDRMCTRLE